MDKYGFCVKYYTDFHTPRGDRSTDHMTSYGNTREELIEHAILEYDIGQGHDVGHRSIVENYDEDHFIYQDMLAEVEKCMKEEDV